jgi:putative (di)nucleoside polyphosphate hydrolase
MNDLPYRPCVGICLINAQGRIFAGKRIDNNIDAWQMPQGGIDRGESPPTAALRELGEETGIPAHLVTQLDEIPDWIPYDLPAELQGRIWGGKYRGQRQKWFLMQFHGQDQQINIATPHPEFSAWQWMGAAALQGAIVPFKRAVYAQVLARFAPHLSP